jgi:hypothetical protein
MSMPAPNGHDKSVAATLQEISVPAAEYLPRIDLLLRALHINRDRLNGKSKIAIDAKLLPVLASSTFSEEFYLHAYFDIGEAHKSAMIRRAPETGALMAHMRDVGALPDGMTAR